MPVWLKHVTLNYMNIQIHDIFVYIICGTVHLLSFKSVTLLIKILQCRRRLRYRTPRSLSTCRHLVMFTIIHSSITIWSFRNFYPCCYLCKSMALIDAHPSWHLFTPDSSDAYRSRRFLLFWNFLPYLLFHRLHRKLGPSFIWSQSWLL